MTGSASMPFQRLLIVGCGNMGGAMLAGWLTGGISASHFTVVDPARPPLPPTVRLLDSLPMAEQFDAILLGIKPQMLAALAGEIARLAGPGSLVLSILAGVESATLASVFPAARGHVRIMPNLAAAIGRSAIALYSPDADKAAQAQVSALMEPLGTSEWLVDEGLFDIVTALAGSGPAFVYRFIDALARGASSLGLPEDQAYRLALATVEGAALLAASGDAPPEELARRVTSPGGTTQAGLEVLDSKGVFSSIVKATLKAARDRGRELARLAKG